MTPAVAGNCRICRTARVTGGRDRLIFEKVPPFFLKRKSE